MPGLTPSVPGLTPSVPFGARSVCRADLGGCRGGRRGRFGPAIGGLLTELISWQAIFVVQVPLSPGQFNLPILFAIPLAFVSHIGSRKILWSLALILVAWRRCFISSDQSPIHRSFAA